VYKQKLTAKKGLRKPSHILRLHLEKLKENLGLFLNLKKGKCPESGKEKKLEVLNNVLFLKLVYKEEKCFYICSSL
jgi:hypothetical protein